MVEFEKNVMDLLDCYLMDEETTSFYCGSLFIECGIMRGRFINDILKENGYNTIVSKCGNEVAIDFI